MTLEAFNAALGEIPSLAKIEAGGEQSAQPDTSLTGEAAWAMVTKFLKKKTPPSAK